jgi:TrmH family RNA methyltransferase
MVITSVNNNHIKELSKLKDKKYRDSTNTYLIETKHLVEEAYKQNLLQELIILDKEDYTLDVPITYVSVEVMKKLATTNTPSSILGVVKKKEENNYLGNKILVLDNIQDPGNLGTIIRSGVAFDVDTIVLSNDTVDLYNPKVIRSSEGMFFHINIIKRDLPSFLDELKENNYTIYGTNVKNGNLVSDITSKSKYALIMGNEGNGVSKELLDRCNSYIYIPMNKTCESLNVGVATSIILYEFSKGVN